jgi:hypothetical protein
MQSRYTRLVFIQALFEIASDTKHLFPTSSVWEQLFYSDLPTILSAQDRKDLEEMATMAGKQLLQHHSSTWNFYYLCLFFVSQLRRMRLKAYDGLWTKEARNSQFALNLYLSLCEFVSRPELLQLFEVDREVQPGLRIVERRRSQVSGKILDIDAHVISDKRLRPAQLLDEVIQALIYGDTQHPSNYLFYLDLLKLLIRLLSSQKQHLEAGDCQEDLFFLILTTQLGHYSNRMVSRLLRNIAEQQGKPSVGSNGLFMSAYTYLFSVDDSRDTTIAEVSMFLLVLLCNQSYLKNNPFAISLSIFSSLQGNFLTYSEISPTLSTTIAEQELSHVSFRQLFDTIHQCFDFSLTPLVLLSLLTHNHNFKLYFLSRTDPETMVLMIYVAFTNSKEII